MAGTNAQIIHILRNAEQPIDAHTIYAAGAFDYEHTCYNGLAQLSKKGLLLREKVGGVFQYVLNKDAPIPDYMMRDLAELEIEGMPAPDPQRRMGMSRAEYTSMSKDEKRTVKQTRSVFHRETEIREVSESIPAPELPVIPVFAESAPQPQQKALPAPAADQPALTLLDEALAKREALDREIAMIRLLADIAGGGKELAFMLQDYDELLELSLSCMDDEGAQVLIENQKKARSFVKLLNEADTSPFKRAAHQLLQWAFLNEDAHAGCHDESAAAALADAAESRKLAALFGVRSKPGEQPK